jgi:hypothetical protein
VVERLTFPQRILEFRTTVILVELFFVVFLSLFLHMTEYYLKLGKTTSFLIRYNYKDNNNLIIQLQSL